MALLTKLVADLHQLSLSDSGALSYRKARLDLIALLERSLEGFADRFQQKGIVLSQQLPPAVTVFGDAERLSQLFHNVLENSLRYTDEGGQLRIVGDLDNHVLILRFYDSAPGASRNSCRTFLNAFTAPRRHAIAPAANRDWVWLSATTSSMPTAGASAPQIRL